MKPGAIICFVLAALTGLVAVNNVFLGGTGRTAADQLAAPGYAVGSFLVPIGLLIGGLAIQGKGRRD